MMQIKFLAAINKYKQKKKIKKDSQTMHGAKKKCKTFWTKKVELKAYAWHKKHPHMAVICIFVSGA